MQSKVKATRLSDLSHGSTPQRLHRLQLRKARFSWGTAGLSMFFRENDLILHSYSTYFRGLDMLLPMYHLLDRTTLGRQEDKGNSMAAGEALGYGTTTRMVVEGNRQLANTHECCHDQAGTPLTFRPPTLG
jgi:hypothetical protein